MILLVMQLAGILEVVGKCIRRDGPVLYVIRCVNYQQSEDYRINNYDGEKFCFQDTIFAKIQWNCNIYGTFKEILIMFTWVIISDTLGFL